MTINQDVLDLPNLTERQEKILGLVVREYINKPEPVGSKYLADKFLHNVSSATIRNELAILEELGLLAAPHTSAGRIPTENGYRYFVKRLLRDHELPADEQRLIFEELTATTLDIETAMRWAVTSLARASRSAAIVTAPRPIAGQFKHLALISTHGQVVMMVLVLQGGAIRQQILTLSETLSQDDLNTLANRINNLANGLTVEGLRNHARTISSDHALDREIIDIVAQAMEDYDSGPTVIYRGGLSDLLPSFTESQAAQQALRVMEEGPLFDGIAAQALNKPIGTVHVVIAGDGRWEEVRHLSLVMSRYGVDGHTEGTLAVFGPMRMPYGRAIPAVRYISHLMTNLLLDMYGLESDDR